MYLYHGTREKLIGDKFDLDKVRKRTTHKSSRDPAVFLQMMYNERLPSMLTKVLCTELKYPSHLPKVSSKKIFMVKQSTKLSPKSKLIF